MKHLLKLPLLLLAIAFTSIISAGSAHAYSNSRLMDDVIFDNSNSMSESQIQTFLAGKGPCLANYSDVDPNWNGTTWSYTGSVSAAHIIYKASQQWGLNPQVIISTLQKEESLITGTSCDAWRYNSAMGYGCPDSGGCNAKYAGFTRQVLWGAWQLKFNKERAYGNTAWDGDGDIVYVGLMTAGDRRRCTTCSLVSYDGNATIDGQVIHMDNGTTASLYTYTPHLGQSFPGIFEGWFGSVLVPTYSWQLVDQRVKIYGTNTDFDPTPGITAGDRFVIYFKALNTGTATWSNSGPSPTRAGTSQPYDRTSVFCEVSWISCSRPVQMQEATVSPGQTGTFMFAAQAPATPGTYNERFNLLAEGVSWMSDIGLYYHLKVNPADFKYSLVSDTLPTQLASGSSGSGAVTLRNDSNFTWYNAPKFPIRIGATSPNDRVSAFRDSSWIGSTRLANQAEFSVAPGQQATFTATLHAPQAAGTYNESLGLVADGIAWAGQSFNHPVTVKQNYDASLDSTSTSIISMGGAERKLVTLKYLNTGLLTWSNAGANPVRISTSSPSDRSSGFCYQSWIACHRPTQLLESSVAPGQTGTFQFYVEGRPWFNSNPYFESFGPIAEGLVRFGAVAQVRVNYTHQSYSWSLTDQYAHTVGPGPTPVDMATMSPGQTIIIGFKARNTGSATWLNDGGFPLRVATSRPTDRSSAFCSNTWIACHRPAQMLEASVAPNQIGTFEFEFKAPTGSPGLHSEYFVPIIESYSYLSDIGLYYRTNVSP